MYLKGLLALVVLLGSLGWAQAQSNTMQATPTAYLAGQWYYLGNPRFPTMQQASPFSGPSPYYYGWGGRVLLTGYGVTPDSYGRMYSPYYGYPTYPMRGWRGGQ